VPADDVDRIRLRERPPVHLLFSKIRERVFEATPKMFVHLDHHSSGIVHRSAPVARLRLPRPDDLPCEQIKKSDDFDNTCATSNAFWHNRAVSAYLISTVTRGSYGRRSGGAPASHLTQDSQRPMALDLPSAVMTQGRWLHGG
jgi:hypothetical protein